VTVIASASGQVSKRRGAIPIFRDVAGQHGRAFAEARELEPEPP